MNDIAHNLNQIQQQITTLDKNSHVKLLTVSKTFPESAIIDAYNTGVRSFGENYPQELASKAKNLSELDIEWHFIGNIQSNKTKLIAEHADWVHTIAQVQHAKRLNEQRPVNSAPLQVLIEVNISGETAKHGVKDFEELYQLALAIQELPRLNLRGLMGMASDTDNVELIRTQFKLLHDYLKQLNAREFNLNELSMGMSNDFPIAIECGATIIRIGSKIFGARIYDN